MQVALVPIERIYESPLPVLKPTNPASEVDFESIALEELEFSRSRTLNSLVSSVRHFLKRTSISRRHHAVVWLRLQHTDDLQGDGDTGLHVEWSRVLCLSTFKAGAWRLFFLNARSCDIDKKGPVFRVRKQLNVDEEGTALWRFRHAHHHSTLLDQFRYHMDDFLRFWRHLVHYLGRHELRNYHLRLVQPRGQFEVQIFVKRDQSETTLRQRTACLSCPVSDDTGSSDSDIETQRALTQAVHWADTPLSRTWIDAKLRPSFVVTPKRHVERLDELTNEETLDMLCAIVAIICFDNDEAAFAAVTDSGDLTLVSASNELRQRFRSVVINQGSCRNLAHLHAKIRFRTKDWQRRIDDWSGKPEGEKVGKLRRIASLVTKKEVLHGFVGGRLSSSVQGQAPRGPSF
ncbi:MAG: hypothetical protein MHM6MM_001294 [Cercozoa sp. M6MM]